MLSFAKSKSSAVRSLGDSETVNPARSRVCVLGFENAGKSKLVQTLQRSVNQWFPLLDSRERQEAVSGEERVKTAGIDLQKLHMGQVPIMVFDFAGKFEK